MPAAGLLTRRQMVLVDGHRSTWVSLVGGGASSHLANPTSYLLAQYVRQRIVVANEEATTVGREGRMALISAADHEAQGNAANALREMVLGSQHYFREKPR